MTDEAAFLAAIREQPADDLRRLVYADWLDEQAGGYSERAEFIRVQVELYRAFPDLNAECVCGSAADKFHCARCMDWDQSEELRRRERELWLTHRNDWFPPGSAIAGQPLYSDEEEVSPLLFIRRGFVLTVRCRLADWCGGECQTCVNWATDGTPRATSGSFACPTCHGSGRTPGHGPQIVAAHPVERVEVTDAGIHPARFSASNDGWVECPESDADAWMVPLTVWQTVVPRPSSDFWKNAFPSRVAAEDALSAKCIGWAKTKNILDTYDRHDEAMMGEILRTLAVPAHLLTAPFR